MGGILSPALQGHPQPVSTTTTMRKLWNSSLSGSGRLVGSGWLVSRLGTAWTSYCTSATRAPTSRCSSSRVACTMAVQASAWALPKALWFAKNAARLFDTLAPQPTSPNMAMMRRTARRSCVMSMSILALTWMPDGSRGCTHDKNSSLSASVSTSHRFAMPPLLHDL